jgi:hypothetical protein
MGPGSGIIGIEKHDLAGSGKVAGIPDVGDDDPAFRRGEIDADGAGRGVGRVETDGNAGGGGLAGRGVGRLARGHGHDLHAHDHEAVVEDPAHQDQKQGQNEGELDEGLAFAPAPDNPQGLEIRCGFHVQGL